MAHERHPPDEPASTAPAPPETEDYDALAAPDDGFEDSEQLPRRPRRRLLAPAPVALVCVLLTACGFIAGVLVEKDQGSSSSGSGGAAGGGGSRLSALRAAFAGAGAAGAETGVSAGSPAGAGGGGAGGSRPTVGQVAFVQGDTLYVTGTEGNTIKVRTTAATTVTKSVSSTAQAIHPGETVVVTGTTSAAGAISAESIRVGGGGGGLASLFGSSGSASGTRGGGAGREAGPALFGGG